MKKTHKDFKFKIMTDEFGDTIVYDETGAIIVFETPRMDRVTAQLIRSIPMPRRLSDLAEYVNMRRMMAIHVLTFIPVSVPTRMGKPCQVINGRIPKFMPPRPRLPAFMPPRPPKIGKL